MKILVTGSSGYLGASFIQKYQKKYQFKTFSLRNEKIEDIDFKNIDLVLHCAALVHQKQEYSYKKYYEINVQYPVKLAKLAKQKGVKQFIFISTVAVYGDDKEKLDENTACNPVTTYGKSKLEAEKQLMEFNDNDFIISIVRIPVIYGKGAPGNIKSLVNLVKKASIIPLGGIKNKRSFISIENLCYLIDAIITQKKSGTFLYADNKSLSTTTLCELIAKGLDKKVVLVKIPLFESIIKLIKPSLHKKLYTNLEVDNTATIKKLSETSTLSFPVNIEDSIKLMLKGENF